MSDLLIGALLSAMIAGVATARGSLNRSGFVTALSLGTVVFAYAGASIFSVLMLFFISSSLLSKLHRGRKKSQRSGWQVLANGGVLFLLIGLRFAWQSDIVSVLMLTSIGIAMSDTWASEIGQKSRALPFHVLTKKPMAPGLSGGVSVLGYFASALAAMIIASISFLVLEVPSFTLALWIGSFSFLGAWVDSVLGLVQVKYITPSGALTENPSSNKVVAKGYGWLDNNWVNFISNLVTTALLGLFLWLF